MGGGRSQINILDLDKKCNLKPIIKEERENYLIKIKKLKSIFQLTFNL